MSAVYYSTWAAETVKLRNSNRKPNHYWRSAGTQNTIQQFKKQKLSILRATKGKNTMSDTLFIIFNSILFLLLAFAWLLYTGESVEVSNDMYDDCENLQETAENATSDAKGTAALVHKENILLVLFVAGILVEALLGASTKTFSECVSATLCGVGFACIQGCINYKAHKNAKQMKKVSEFYAAHKDCFYGLTVAADLDTGLAVKVSIPSSTLAFESRKDAKKAAENIFLHISKEKIDVRTCRSVSHNFDKASQQFKDVFVGSKSLGPASVAIANSEKNSDNNDEGDYFNVYSNRPEYTVVGDGIEQGAKLLNQEELNQCFGDREIVCQLSVAQIGLRKRKK